MDLYVRVPNTEVIVLRNKHVLFGVPSAKAGSGFTVSFGRMYLFCLIVRTVTLGRANIDKTFFHLSLALRVVMCHTYNRQGVIGTLCLARNLF